MSNKIGILAFGSLIDDPGPELDPLIVSKEDIETPFNIEYARQSGTTRGGAPTLVPVTSGGGKVKAKLLKLKSDMSLETIKDMLYRREIHQVGNLEKTYNPESTNPNAVRIGELYNFHELEIVLYASLPQNIETPSAETLADLAIQSARKEAGTNGKDGILYLINNIKAGIETPLTQSYRQAILDKTDTSSLEEARQKIISQR